MLCRMTIQLSISHIACLNDDAVILKYAGRKTFRLHTIEIRNLKIQISAVVLWAEVTAPLVFNQLKPAPIQIKREIRAAAQCKAACDQRGLLLLFPEWK